MWSQRDPSLRRSGEGNIFIKNLDLSIGHRELYDTFSVFGNILSCKVEMDETGKSKGFGFVHFETKENAEKAIEVVHDKLLAGKKVHVCHWVPKRERQPSESQPWTNVYVKDLDEDVTDEELRRVFEAIGPVTSAIVVKDSEGRSRGFGFVNFEKHKDAAKAVDVLHETQIGKKTIWCNRAQKKADRIAELKRRFAQIRLEFIAKYHGVNLFVKNLEADIDDERLEKEFSSFGQITSAKVMRRANGISKGFGFVCYTTPEEAQNAISEMNGRVLQNCDRPLYVALHEPKELRMQRLATRRKILPPVYSASPIFYPNKVALRQQNLQRDQTNQPTISKIESFPMLQTPVAQTTFGGGPAPLDPGSIPNQAMPIHSTIA
jgi:polyadenylate-binding protein